MGHSLKNQVRRLLDLFRSRPDPTSPGFVLRGEWLRRKGRLNEAEDVVLEGLKPNPEFASGHVVAGRTESSPEPALLASEFGDAPFPQGPHGNGGEGSKIPLAHRPSSRDEGMVLSPLAAEGQLQTAVEMPSQSVPIDVFAPVYVPFSELTEMKGEALIESPPPPRVVAIGELAPTAGEERSEVSSRPIPAPSADG